MTRLLKLEAPLPRRKQRPLEFVPASRAISGLLEIELPPGSPAAAPRILVLNLTKTALVVLRARGDDFPAPRGDTLLAGRSNREELRRAPGAEALDPDS